MSNTLPPHHLTFCKWYFSAFAISFLSTVSRKLSFFQLFAKLQFGVLQFVLFAPFVKWEQGLGICAFCTVCQVAIGSCNLCLLSLLSSGNRLLQFVLFGPFAKSKYWTWKFCQVASGVCHLCLLSPLLSESRVLQFASFQLFAKW